MRRFRRVLLLALAAGAASLRVGPALLAPRRCPRAAATAHADAQPDAPADAQPDAYAGTGSVGAKQRRLLVLGGSGFVGREVCREAVSRGWAVRSVSRRGLNPEPSDQQLVQVEWVSGDAREGETLSRAAAGCDAAVHAVGMLFDGPSGLGPLNPLVSGARAGVAPDSTYAQLAAEAAEALVAGVRGTGCGVVAYVSAAEAGWAEREAGREWEAGLPEWGRRYLEAKRRGEAAVLGAATAGVRPVVCRPSLMWSYAKLDVLPLVPIIGAAAAVGIGGGRLTKPMRADHVGPAIVCAIESTEVRGVLEAEQLHALTPLSAAMRPTAIDVAASGFASIARAPYGIDAAPRRDTDSDADADTDTDADADTDTDTDTDTGTDREADADADTKADAMALVLYDMEGCAWCRRVREMCTYLDLTLSIRPCGVGSRHRAGLEAAAAAAGRRASLPYLEDRAAGLSLFDSDAIVDHLMQAYAKGLPLPPPSAYFLPSLYLTGWLPSLLRPSRGIAVHPQADPSPPALPLALYSYESNQFCRLVREALTELDLPYILTSTGKGSPNREGLGALAGRSTAPYLQDPNTGVAMFESADIVAYLWRTYSK